MQNAQKRENIQNVESRVFVVMIFSKENKSIKASFIYIEQNWSWIY